MDQRRVPQIIIRPIYHYYYYYHTLDRVLLFFLFFLLLLEWNVNENDDNLYNCECVVCGREWEEGRGRK